jgi:hypothetical protein
MRFATDPRTGKSLIFDFSTCFLPTDGFRRDGKLPCSSELPLVTSGFISRLLVVIVKRTPSSAPRLGREPITDYRLVTSWSA